MPALGKSCVFCGGRPLHKEHLLPNWLRQHVPNAALELISTDYHGIAGASGNASAAKHRGRSFDLTVKAVCQRCNNGWMSDLESEVKSIITPMLEGYPWKTHGELNRVHLSLADQRIIAAWVVKTVLMWHLASRTPADLPHEYFAALRETGQPPPGCRVWMGCYVGEKMWSFHESSLKVPSPSGEPPDNFNGYGETLSVRYLIFQVIGVPGPQGARFIPSDSHRRIVHEIWPFPQPFAWPGQRFVNTSGLRYLAEAFIGSYVPEDAYPFGMTSAEEVPESPE
jgi:hypothetical protein